MDIQPIITNPSDVIISLVIKTGLGAYHFNMLKVCQNVGAVICLKYCQTESLPFLLQIYWFKVTV